MKEDLEDIRTIANEESERFFKIQVKIDDIDLQFHQMEELIGRVTGNIKLYSEFKRHVDTIEVLNFYRHILGICQNIVSEIEKAEIELMRTHKSENTVTELKDYEIEEILKESGKERIDDEVFL